jgi:hypothetical protein
MYYTVVCFKVSFLLEKYQSKGKKMGIICLAGRTDD